MSIIAWSIQAELEKLLVLMEQVYDVTYRKEIEGVDIPDHPDPLKSGC